MATYNTDIPRILLLITSSYRELLLDNPGDADVHLIVRGHEGTAAGPICTLSRRVGRLGLFLRLYSTFFYCTR